METPYYIKGRGLVDLETFSIDDLPKNHYMVAALYHINRFAGMYGKVPVTAHSINCWYIAKALGYTNTTALVCLLHDFPECIIGDIPSPIKRKFFQIRDYEVKILEAIYRREGIYSVLLNGDVNYSEVELCDKLCLILELRMLELDPSKFLDMDRIAKVQIEEAEDVFNQDWYTATLDEVQRWFVGELTHQYYEDDIE